MQAWARRERYKAADDIGLDLDADVAAGHTASDQVETLLYRLAASPGRRALLGMRERSGRLVRPLLAFTRAQTAAHCESRGLAWREDPSNDDQVFARSRVRGPLLDALRSIHPDAEANVLRTIALLRDEAAVLEAVVGRALRDIGAADEPGPVELERVAALAPALRRLVLQHLADVAVGDGDGELAPAIGDRVDEVLGLARAGGTASLDLGGGLRAVVSYGELRLHVGPAAEAVDPPAVTLPVPGQVDFAGGAVVAELGDFEIADGVLDAAAAGPDLEVRAWRPGDRMRPLGLGGSKSLQDIFTDAKLPSERRHAIPVVLSGGEIAWIPGIATGEAFRVGDRTLARLRLRWRES